MNLPQRSQFLGLLATASVVLFVGDRLVFSPFGALWKQRATRIAELRKSVTDGSLLLQREASIRHRWESMRTNTLSAETSVAENQVLRAFDQWARESGLSLSAIKPQWKRNSDDFAALDCRVDAQGNLSAITRFLHSVERDPLALRIEAVDLTSRDDVGEQLNLGLQVSGLQLSRSSP